MNRFFIMLLIVWGLSTESRGQLAYVRNSNSLAACGAAVPFVVKFNTGADFDLTIPVNHGLELDSIRATIPFMITDTLDHALRLRIDTIVNSSDSLVYFLRAGCHASEYRCNNSTSSFIDTLLVDGVPALSTQSYNILAACLYFNVNTDTSNYVYRGVTGEQFIRRTTLRNKGNSPFSGDFSFRVAFHTASQVKHLQLTASNGVPITILDTIYTADSAYVKARVTGIGITDYITVAETVEIQGCTNGAEGNASYRIRYGCQEKDLCGFTAHSETSRVIQNTPLLTTKILTDSKNCVIGNKQQGYIVKNTSNGLASHIKLTLYHYGKRTYKIVRKRSVNLTLSNPHQSHLEDSLITAYTTPQNNCNVNESELFNTIEYNIDFLYPGDSLIITYDKETCCPEPSYNTSYSFAEDIALRTEYKDACGLEKPVSNINYSRQQLAYNQGDIEPTSLTNMDGGDTATFHIKNNDFQAGTGITIPFSQQGALLKVRLILTGGFVYTANSLTITNPHTSPYILNPSYEKHIGDDQIENGDTVEVYFKIPFLNPRSFFGLGNGTDSRVNFTLSTLCPAPPTSEIIQEIYFNPDTTCASNCFIALSRKQKTINIQCPGCPVPGMVADHFELKRITLGEADNDNNLLPDNEHYVKANSPNLRLDRGWKGDTLQGTLISYISNGDITYDSLGFDFRYAGYEVSIPQGSKILTILPAKVTLIRDSLAREAQIPVSSIKRQLRDTLTIYKFDLSLDTLAQYGLDTNGIRRFEVADILKIYPTFVITEHEASFKEKIVNIQNYLYVTGVPLNDLKAGDVNDPLINYTDSLAYWCEQIGGTFTFIGKDFKRLAISASNTVNADFCKKEVNIGGYYYNKEPQFMINHFPYEYRRVPYLDSMVYLVPDKYTVDSIKILNTYYDESSGEKTNISDNIMPDRIETSNDSVWYVIHPSRYFTRYTSYPTDKKSLFYTDENHRVILRFYLSPNCITTPDTIRTHYAEGVFKYPDSQTTAFTNKQSISQPNVWLTVPRPVFSFIDRLSKQAQRKEICYDNLTLTNTSTLYNAEHTFISIVSPSGRFIPTSVSGATAEQGMFRLGTINKNSAKTFSICGNYTCGDDSLTMINRDSIYVYYGTNCGRAATHVDSGCTSGYSVFYIQPTHAGFHASVSVQDTVSAFDTLNYRVKLTASGIGSIYNIKIKATLSGDERITFTDSKLRFPDTTGTSYITVLPYYFSKDSVIWYMDSLLGGLNLPFIQSGFHNGDSSSLVLDINMDFIKICGENFTDEVRFDISGTTYCGKDIAIEPFVKVLRIEGPSFPLAYAGEDTLLMSPYAISLGAAPVDTYVYRWMPSTSLNSDTVANPVLNVDSTRWYVLSVTDSNGCSAQDSVLVAVAQTIADAGDDKVICRGKAVSIGRESLTGITYSWSPSGSLSNHTIANPVANPDTTTIYVLTATLLWYAENDTIIVEVLDTPEVEAGESQTICYNSNATLTPQATGGNPGYSYNWTPTPTSIDVNGEAQVQGIKTTTSYIIEVTDSKGCKGIDTTTLYIRPRPTAYISTVTGQASFRCGGDSVELAAYPQNTQGHPALYSYQWSNTSGILIGADSSHYKANASGRYWVTILENICGYTSTDSVDVIDSLQISCPDSICPGEIPAIRILNAGNVAGTYKAQWYDPNGTDSNLSDDLLMSHGISTSGYYYAAAITPACTLRTNQRTPPACSIEVKRAPAAYHITTDRPSEDAPIVFLCDGQTVSFSIDNPSINSSYENPIGLIWRNGTPGFGPVNWPGTYSDTIALTIEELEKGGYFVVAIDSVTHCRAISNTIRIETPRVAIHRYCEEGQVRLRASSNFQIAANAYDWSYNGQPLAQNTQTVIATQAGIYTVTEKETGCTQTDKCWGIREHLNTTSTHEEQLSIQDRSFEGIDNCGHPKGFDTDFECLDRNSYTGGPLPADLTIGKFMINQPGLQASDWSPNIPPTWINSGTYYNGPGALLLDGNTDQAPKLIWGKTVPVEHGLYYLFRFKVRNIDIQSQVPVQEIPELYVEITYKDSLGYETKYKTSRQALFHNGNHPWIEFSGFSPALPYIIPGCANPTEIKTVRLELKIDGGGAIGRDISVDEFSLIPIGLCDETVPLDLPCNTALAQLDQTTKIVCPGSSASFNIINAPLGVSYKWQGYVDSMLTVLDTDTYFETPVLTLTDPDRPSVYSYQVTITDTLNNCSTVLSVTAIVSPEPSLSIAYSSTDSVCQGIFTAVFEGLGSPSSYTWMLDSVMVADTTSQLIVNDVDNYSRITCQVSGVWCDTNGVVSHSLILDGCTPASRKQSAADTEKERGSLLRATLYPNPTMTESKLLVTGTQTERVSVSIMDLNGVEVYANRSVVTGQELSIGLGLRSGVYTVKISDKEDIIVLRLIITR